MAGRPDVAALAGFAESFIDPVESKGSRTMLREVGVYT
jgi:hypothetical protein